MTRAERILSLLEEVNSDAIAGAQHHDSKKWKDMSRKEKRRTIGGLAATGAGVAALAYGKARQAAGKA